MPPANFLLKNPICVVMIASVGPFAVSSHHLFSCRRCIICFMKFATVLCSPMLINNITMRFPFAQLPFPRVSYVTSGLYAYSIMFFQSVLEVKSSHTTSVNSTLFPCFAVRRILTFMFLGCRALPQNVAIRFING